MDNLLHQTAVILIILWAIGFFAISAGPIIHILLFIAFISITLGIVHAKRELQ